MTDMLDKAFEQASHLPEDEQDKFAAFILDELQSERRWMDALSGSADRLAELAREAKDEHQSGKSHPFAPTDE